MYYVLLVSESLIKNKFPLPTNCNITMEELSKLVKPMIRPNKTKNKEVDVEQIWKSAKEQLRLYISDSSMKSWYSNVYLDKVDSGIAELTCDSNYKRDWIESNNRSLLKRILSNTIGQNVDLVITIRSSFKPKEESRSYEYYNPDQNPLFTPVNRNATLNPRYTFNNFIIGSGNQLAHAVAEAVSEEPGTVYNPVFLYGGTGVGKTHLMLASGNAVLAKFPNKRVIYTPIESFLNEMITSIRKRTAEEFRRKYRDIDMLIIDDIQFISNYPKTQDELFNTFNTLYLANKQIFMASDRLPKDIPNLTDRLRSRFEGGMVIDIQPPDFETRIAIIQQKAEESNSVIPEEIVTFVAGNLESNIREIEGAVTKIISIENHTGKLPTLEEVAKMLKVDIASRRARVKPKKIIQITSEIFECTPKEVLSGTRVARVAIARQVVMFLMREELKLPLEKIAVELKRKDHTTVLHAHKKITELAKDNVPFREKLDKCRFVIREM